MKTLNCSGSFPVPDVWTMYENFTSTQFTLFVIAGALNTVVILFAVLHILTVWKNLGDEKIRSKVYILALLFPMLALLSFTAMISPRSGPMYSSIGLLYIQFCMYTVTSLCRLMYKGRDELSSALVKNEAAMTFQVPPLCCCMPCLPKAHPSERNLKIVECLVLQGPIIRAFIVIVNSLFLAEKGPDSEHLLKMTELAGILSLLFTLFGCHIMAKLTEEYIRRIKLTVMFRFVDISMALFSAQLPLIFQLIFLNLDIIKCGPILSALGNAQFLCNFVIVAEMFLLTILATKLLSRGESELYHSPRSKRFETSEQKMLPKEDP